MTELLEPSWALRLAELQQFIPDAVIAGGCLRDRWAGVKWKDVDIFVYSDARSAGERRRLLEDAWPDLEIVDQFEKVLENSGSDAVERGVQDVFIAEPYNVIFMDKPFTLKDLVEGFDIGATMIATDGTYTYADERFLRDMHEKTFTVHRTVTLERSKQRMDRWKERYPDFRQVLPPEETLVF
jgi:hypothetical protein